MVVIFDECPLGAMIGKVFNFLLHNLGLYPHKESSLLIYDNNLTIFLHTKPIMVVYGEALILMNITNHKNILGYTYDNNIGT